MIIIIDMFGFFSNIDMIPGRLVYIFFVILVTFIFFGVESFRKRISVLRFFKKNIATKFDKFNFEDFPELDYYEDFEKKSCGFRIISGFIGWNVLKVEKGSIKFKYMKNEEIIRENLPAKYLSIIDKTKIEEVDIVGFRNNMLVVKRLRNDLLLIALFKKIDYSALFK